MHALICIPIYFVLCKIVWRQLSYAFYCVASAAHFLFIGGSMMSENNLKIKVSAKEQNLAQNDDSAFDQHTFISDIYECEKQLYIFDARLRKLFVKRTVGPTDFPKEFKNSVEYKNYCKEFKKKKPLPKEVRKPIFDTTTFLDSVITTGVLPGAILGLVINIIVDIIIKHIIVWPLFLIAMIVAIGSLAFNLWIYNGEKNEYTNYLNEVDSIKKQNAQKVQYNNERYKYWQDKYYKEKELARKHFDENECILLDNEADLIRKNKAKIENTLAALYNLRINGVLCLHPNYQGLVPISVIYGYFDTGRCTQLQGHEGAYNLYEDEKMKGMIINKLDIVSQQLGQLNNSMVYVGQAIEECNNRLSDLESTSNRMIQSVNNMNNNVTSQLNGVSNQMAAIEENTANSAYYSEVGARMTTFNTVYNLFND